MEKPSAYIQALTYALLPYSEPEAALRRALEYNELPLQPSGLQPLRSILSSVGKEQPGEHYFSPGPLSLNEENMNLFAGTDSPGDTGQVAQNARQAIDRISDLFSEGAPAYRYTLFHLVQTWGSRVALSGDELSDTSVFDRNRILAAMTAIFQQSDSDDLLLVKGAVSGIQTFIYEDIQAEQIGESQKTSKRLRGRSFFVDLLNATLAEYIVETLGLEQANIIFVGGGHFNLLLPASAKSRLAEIAQFLNLELPKEAGQRLSLLIAGEECAAKDLIEHFPDKYTRLNERLEQKKQRRHLGYLDQYFQRNTQSKRSLILREAEDIGQAIPYAKYLVEVQAVPDVLQALVKTYGKQCVTSLQVLGRVVWMPRAKDVSDLLRQLPEFLAKARQAGAIDQCKVIIQNDPDIQPVIEALVDLEPDIGIGYRFFGKETPMTEGTPQVMMFEDLAALDQNKEPALNYPRLGVMRLDVDDLGAIFQAGLRNNPRFSRMACLSREFQLFFGGYFNHLAHRHHMYITYSGGDDAFVIGSWINAIHFARELHQAFRRFTCHNDHLSFSAGIFMCHPKYPIARFAYDAADLEEAAKGLGVTDQEPGKNALSIFNHLLHWDTFQEMMDFTRRLEAVMTNDQEERQQVASGNKIRRSTVRKLLDMQKATRNQDDFEFYRHAARFHALLARQGFNQQRMQDSKDASDSRKLVQEILQEMNKPDRFQHYIVPVQYVLSKTRTANN